MSLEKELEKLFDDPLLKNVEDEDLSLFVIPEYLNKITKDKPDYVAQRVPCLNFSDYEEGFKRVHRELNLGKRSLCQLKKDQSLQAGSYYITSGVLLFIEHIDELQTKVKRKKKDARTRSIYENGTESSIYLDSLRKSITTDGYVVTESTDIIEEDFQQKFGITNADIQDGWVYVLSSLSEKVEIKEQKDLYKIGYSTIPIPQRIANAQNDPTYLMDKVKIVASWKTFNMNTQKFEDLIHKFFKGVQFNVRVKDKNGKIFIAREWYIAPLGIIETVIKKIIDGSIVNYRYNPSLKGLEKIEKTKEDLSPNYDTKGMNILNLIIKKVLFDDIIEGRKKTEYRQIKQTTLNRHTWISNDDGKRYLKKYDAILFYVGNKKDRYSALIEVTDTTYDNEKRIVEYHLGKILEISQVN